MTDSSRGSAGSLGLEGMARDPRFATNPARVTNRVEMERALIGEDRPWKRDDLLAALEKAVVPAGPINTIADLFADPQFKARGMRIEPQGTPGVRSPIVMSDKPACARTPFAEARRASGRDPARDRARRRARRLTAVGAGGKSAHEHRFGTSASIADRATAATRGSAKRRRRSAARSRPRAWVSSMAAAAKG